MMDTWVIYSIYTWSGLWISTCWIHVAKMLQNVQITVFGSAQKKHGSGIF